MTEDQVGNPIQRGHPPVTRTGAEQASGVSKPLSGWPTTIGAVSIVFGVLASLNGLYGVVSSVFAESIDEWLRTFVPAGQPTGMEVMADNPGLLAFNSFLVLVAAVLLLVLGIGLVKRRVWGAKLVPIWAVIKIVVATMGGFVGYHVAQGQLEAMSNDPDLAAMPAGFTDTMVVVGFAVGVLWGLAMPVFLLIWFSRARIKEEVSQWA